MVPVEPFGPPVAPGVSVTVEEPSCVVPPSPGGGVVPSPTAGWVVLAGGVPVDAATVGSAGAFASSVLGGVAGFFAFAAGAGAARGARPAARGGARAELRHEQLHRRDRADRIDGRQRAVRAPQLDAEGPAALARLEVPANRGGGARQSLGDLPQLEPHLVAAEEPRLRGLGQ